MISLQKKCVEELIDLLIGTVDDWVFENGVKQYQDVGELVKLLTDLDTITAESDVPLISQLDVWIDVEAYYRQVLNGPKCDCDGVYATVKSHFALKIPQLRL